MSGFVVALIEPLPIDQLQLPSYIIDIRGQRWSRGIGGSETFPISDEMFEDRMQAGEIRSVTPVPTPSLQRVVVWAGDELLATVQAMGLALPEIRPHGQIENRGCFWLLFPHDAYRFVELWLFRIAQIAFQRNMRLSKVMANISPDHPWTLALTFAEANSEEEREAVLTQWSKTAPFAGPTPTERLEVKRQIESAVHSLQALVRQTP